LEKIRGGNALPRQEERDLTASSVKSNKLIDEGRGGGKKSDYSSFQGNLGDSFPVNYLKKGTSFDPSHKMEKGKRKKVLFSRSPEVILP